MWSQHCHDSHCMQAPPPPITHPSPPTQATSHPTHLLQERMKASSASTPPLSTMRAQQALE